jgi:hypothetical protein
MEPRSGHMDPSPSYLLEQASVCWIYALDPIGLDPLMGLMDLIH